MDSSVESSSREAGEVSAALVASSPHPCSPLWERLAQVLGVEPAQPLSFYSACEAVWPSAHYLQLQAGWEEGLLKEASSAVEFAQYKELLISLLH